MAAGTSIAMSMTGDQALMLHQVKEKEREKLREQIVNSFHKASKKENSGPFNVGGLVKMGGKRNSILQQSMTSI